MIPRSFVVIFMCLLISFIGVKSGAVSMQSDNGTSTSEIYSKYFSSLSSSTPSTHYLSRYLRRLIGSNCLYIERGEVTPYYDCIGCVVEKAVACVDDMRFNRSGTVRMGCSFDRLGEKIDTSCCPVVEGEDVNYIGSSYPTALQCLTQAGCKDTIIYDDILAECTRACNYNDPRSSQSICFAGKSGTFRRSFFYFVGYFVLIGLSCLLLF